MAIGFMIGRFEGRRADVARVGDLTRALLFCLSCGALEANATDDPRLAQSARLVRESAGAAMDDLRSLLDVMREPVGAELPPMPLSHLAQVVHESFGAGQPVSSSIFVSEPDRADPQLSRAVYRIVQEVLTNARKHAPGSPVDVAVSHETGAVRVHVVNPIADLAPPDRTGAGLGLIGVDERVALLGGSVSHGVQDGRFVLDVVLPIRDAKEQL